MTWLDIDTRLVLQYISLFFVCRTSQEELIRIPTCCDMRCCVSPLPLQREVPPLWWIVDANVLPRFKHRRSSSQTQWYRRSKAGLSPFKQARVDMMSRWLEAKEGKKERCKKGWHSRRGEGQSIARERPRPRWRKTTWRVSEDNVVMQGWSGRKGEWVSEWVRGRKKEEWKRKEKGSDE